MFVLLGEAKEALGCLLLRGDIFEPFDPGERGAHVHRVVRDVAGSVTCQLVDVLTEAAGEKDARATHQAGTETADAIDHVDPCLAEARIHVVAIACHEVALGIVNVLRGDSLTARRDPAKLLGRAGNVPGEVPIAALTDGGASGQVGHKLAGPCIDLVSISHPVGSPDALNPPVRAGRG